MSLTLKELNKDCPEHDRTSCSDDSPINAGVDLRGGNTWCRRCEGLSRMKQDLDRKTATDEIARLQAENAALRKSFACPGIPRAGCHYLAHCNSVCDKCGKVHSGLALANHLAAHPDRKPLTLEQTEDYFPEHRSAVRPPAKEQGQ